MASSSLPDTNTDRFSDGDGAQRLFYPFQHEEGTNPADAMQRLYKRTKRKCVGGVVTRRPRSQHLHPLALCARSPSVSLIAAVALLVGAGPVRPSRTGRGWIG